MLMMTPLPEPTPSLIATQAAVFFSATALILASTSCRRLMASVVDAATHKPTFPVKHRTESRSDLTIIF